MTSRRRLLAAAPALALVGSRLARAQEGSHEGPQPELPKETLTIVTRDGQKHVFHVEMALTEQQQETGLMFRPTVPADGGMLFDWGAPRESQMWMKNTIASLDMVFIGADGTIRHIVEDTTPRSLAVIDSVVPVRATLELAAGVTARLGIRVGDKAQARIFASAS